MPYVFGVPEGLLSPPIAMDQQPSKNVNSKVAQIPSLTRPQLIEDACGCKPIRNPAVFGLEITNCGTSLEAEKAVGLADIIALAFQQLLQLQSLGARQHTLVRWPFLHEGPTAT